MTRWLKSSLIASLMVLVATAVSAQEQYHIRVNGREIVSNPPPQNIDGRLFVPLRAVSEALGAQIDYDANTSTAIITTANSDPAAAVRIAELTKLTQTQASMLSAPIRESLPGVQVYSAYLSVKIDTLQGSNLDNLMLDMSAGTLDRYDGIHIMAQDALVTIHGSDIQDWKAGKLTGPEFIDRWDITGGPSAPTTSPTPAPPVIVPAPTGDVIESKIDGTFEGWTGDTLFVLTNGQIWKQTSYAYTYHYAYMPKVLIYRSGAVWKMKVDGVTSEITVTRLK